MQRPFFLIAALLLLTFDTTAQLRTIIGKVIDESDLSPIPMVFIQSSDTTLLTQYDVKGQFEISIPINTKSLIIGQVGFEPAFINLTDSCNQFDIILLSQSIYDFMSLKKVDKLRMRQFKKLQELHFVAYRKGIFQNGSACYTQSFIPHYHRNKSK